MKGKIIIYADGSSLGNPGPGGWGVIIARNDNVLELGGGDPYTTNNKMELTAAIEALSRVKEKKGIVIRTDSRYVINGITKWAAGWERAGWVGKNKKEILNRDLWSKLLKTVGDKIITWEHVHGHAGIPGNERADAIATAFAKDEKQKLFDGSLTGYQYDLITISETKNRPPKKKNSGKAYSYLSLVNGVVARHLNWVECEQRVKGASGAKFKKALSALDEKKILSEWGVHSPKF